MFVLQRENNMKREILSELIINSIKSLQTNDKL